MTAPDRSFPNGSAVCDYWLSRCEGFTVRAGHRTLGVVEHVAGTLTGGRTESIVLRKGHRRRVVPVHDILAVVPARKVVLARRHEHAKPAARFTGAALGRAAAVAWALALQVAHWLEREVPPLVERIRREIAARNRLRTAPTTRRTHRAANRYAFALDQQPLGRGRNVGPTRTR
ncbi:MAG: hypothetical protein JOY72_09565 [Actinobacteria bacterium]|nr:hypothetical protein [Actinomycetota bacterium]